jgi:hypothetical protein
MNCHRPNLTPRQRIRRNRRQHQKPAISDSFEAIEIRVQLYRVRAELNYCGREHCDSLSHFVHGRSLVCHPNLQEPSSNPSANCWTSNKCLCRMDKLTFTILLHELAGALKRLSSFDSYIRAN